MTVGRIFTKIYIFISLSWDFFQKLEKLKSHTESKWWPGDPDVKDDPNDPLTRWPNYTVPCLMYSRFCPDFLPSLCPPLSFFLSFPALLPNSFPSLFVLFLPVFLSFSSDSLSGMGVFWHASPILQRLPRFICPRFLVTNFPRLTVIVVLRLSLCQHSLSNYHCCNLKQFC